MRKACKTLPLTYVQGCELEKATKRGVKVEVSVMGANIRYIVIDLIHFRTKDLYEKGYCARGAMELRIKDHKLYLRSDRYLCSSFSANQFCLFLHSIAYVLLHTLQNLPMQLLKPSRTRSSKLQHGLRN